MREKTGLLALCGLMALNPITVAEPVCSSQELSATASSAQQDKERETAERDWNERLRQARERVKDLERRADQAELEIVRLRNIQFSPAPQDAGTSAKINRQVAELSALMRRLRAEAVVAQHEVNTLLEEGEIKQFKLHSLSPTTETGEPNLNYYRKRFLELQTDLRDAEARAQVMRLRANDLRRRITINSVTGDNFFIGRLRDELEETQQGLELARARIATLSQQLEELRQRAHAAGVPPGILR